MTYDETWKDTYGHTDYLLCIMRNMLAVHNVLHQMVKSFYREFADYWRLDNRCSTVY